MVFYHEAQDILIERINYTELHLFAVLTELLVSRYYHWVKFDNGKIVFFPIRCQIIFLLTIPMIVAMMSK